MGRKKAIKRKLGFSRNEYYKILREGSGQEKIIIDGQEINLNPLKHILMNKTYNNDEMNKYLRDVLSQYKRFLKQVNEEKPVEDKVEETGGEKVESESNT